MNRQSTIIIILLGAAVILTYIILNAYGEDRPTISEDLSSDRSIQITDDTITIDLSACKPDLRRIDTFSGGVIVEVAGKEFGDCLINYGVATHDRNLNQKLPNRCIVPTGDDRPLSLTIKKSSVDFTPIEQHCSKE